MATNNNLKHFTASEPAISATLIGLGQAGGRMVDEFAKIRTSSGAAAYNCLALNSNDGDLKELKYILPTNQHCLSSLGGFGKDPERALEILEKNKSIRQELTEFVTERVPQGEDMVIFFAGFGGGTGTSTLLKAVEDFFEHFNKPVLQKKMQEIYNHLTPEERVEFEMDPRVYMIEAAEEASNELTKIGIVVAEPLRSDGPDVLRQVNEFNKKVWGLAKDPVKGISFITFLDNQKFYDEFSALKSDDRNRLQIHNFRDYGNRKFAQIFHELNTATTIGGTSVVFDKQDFKRLVTEHQGCLVINKVSKPVEKVMNEHDLEKMFEESIGHSAFHEDIDLVSAEQQQDGSTAMVASKVYHLGMLAVLARDKAFSSNFIDNAKISISNELPMDGTVFSGYIQTNNDFQASVYTVYKTDALPRRLKQGLVEEYMEHQKKLRSYKYESSGIATINTLEPVEAGKLAFEDFGFETGNSAKERRKARRAALEPLAPVATTEEVTEGSEDGEKPAKKFDIMNLKF